jgi:hypothetical protein
MFRLHPVTSLYAVRILIGWAGMTPCPHLTPFPKNQQATAEFTKERLGLAGVTQKARLYFRDQRPR